MTNLYGKMNLLKILSVCIAIPSIGLVVCEVAFPSLTWMEVSVHSLFESIGFFAGIFVAILLLLQGKERREVSSDIWIISALFGMAILDGFHASVSPGNTFIWLHSIAVLTGGILFAGIWLSPPSVTKRGPSTTLPLGIAALCIIIGSISVAFPQILPLMSTGTSFTISAIASNIIGEFCSS